MTVRRGLTVAGLGAILFVVGFAIGSTQTNETGVANGVAAILGTAGAAIAAIGLVLVVVGLLRRS
jgi:hypothetical protein